MGQPSASPRRPFSHPLQDGIAGALSRHGLRTLAADTAREPGPAAVSVSRLDDLRGILHKAEWCLFGVRGGRG